MIRAVEYGQHQRGHALTSEIRESLAETLTTHFPGATIHLLTRLAIAPEPTSR